MRQNKVYVALIFVFIVTFGVTMMLANEDNTPKTYVVTCMPPMNTNDTINTTNYLVNLRNTYRIGDAHYSTALCNVKRIQ